MADKHKNQESNCTPTNTTRVEESSKELKTEANDNEKNTSDELRLCSPSRLPPSSAPPNPFATSQNNCTARGILKPPQLSLNNTNSSKSIVLHPSRLNPPVSSTPDSSTAKSNQVNGETPRFVPLLHNAEPKTSIAQAVPTNVTSNSFVFGQNLQERVINKDAKNDDPKPSTSLNSNGTSEMLFSSAVKSEVRSEPITKETKSLSESAREYEESRAVKRKYEEVEVKTGEENETNILNINCKLFAFDKSSGSWQERGRGVLRLNDFETEGNVQSRLLFRTTGNLRVILNTKIWAEMTVEQASEKGVRFTALDPQGTIRVYLAMASIEESRQLHLQIQLRVQREIGVQKHKKPSAEADSGGN